MPLADYVSPVMRMGVFRRLYPGAKVSYKVVPIGEAFPEGHYGGKGEPVQAVICTIKLADGTQVRGAKEIDLFEQVPKSSNWRAVEQTAEQMQKDETKAMGRALRDMGIPSHWSEIQPYMRWLVALLGNEPPQTARLPRGADPATGEITPVGRSSPDDVDPADASDDNLTPEQELAQRIAGLDGPAKAEIGKRAKEELKVSNVMRAGEHASTILGWLPEEAEEES